MKHWVKMEQGEKSKLHKNKILQTCYFSGIFRISGIANHQHWIFLNFLDDCVMFLEKSEAIFPFSGIKQGQWWHF